MSEINLPEGWAISTVGDYLHLKNGFAFKSNNYVPANDNTYPVIRISDLDGQVATDLNAMHVENGAEGFEVKKGDLLIAMSGATTGKVGVYQGSKTAYQNQRVGNLKLHSEIYGNNRYKNHLISSLSEQILKIAYGGAQPNISGKAIEGIDIILPPLAEQKVIADKLDTLLAQVEATKARLDRIPQILKTFRQSVLAAAVSGKLTEEWRGGSKNWSYPKIKQVGKVQLGRQRSPKYHIGENMKPYLRVQNVFEDFIDTADVMAMEFSSEDFERYRLKFGDVLLNEGQSPKFLGRPAIYRDELENACFTNTLIRFQASDLTSPEYALIVFRNHMHSGRYISEGTITTNIAHLGSGRFGNVEFPLPPKKEQTQIVRRVEGLFASADRIEQKANAALERVNNLTQSILAKAFRGELTADWRAQNPDLISGDNSAEALLEKIKAEREALSSKKKPKKKAVKKAK